MNLKLLEKMLQIYSPTGEEGPLAKFLRKELTGRGFDARIDRVGNVIGSKGTGEREVLLVGHMDTVSGEIPVKVRAGTIYGRGSVDAKGSLAAFIEAASRVKPPPELTVRIIGCVDEEGESKGAQHLIDRYRPDWIVIGEPSGWDAVTLGYKGSFWLRYRLKKPLAHRGYEGRTAAEEAVRCYEQLVERYPTETPRFDAVNVTLISINTAPGPFEESVEMFVGIRTPPGFEIAELEGWIEENREVAQVEASEAIPAIKVGKDNRLVRSFLGAIRAEGGRPRFKVKTGTSDMNLLGHAWNVPIVAYGPGDSRLDHTPEEHLELEECERAVAVLTRAMDKIFDSLGAGGQSK
ncbi:MAG: [LysW]-lysine hydrolase [Candidatus Bipolaricaulia bacterium]